MTDENATQLLEHLLAFGDVVVQAFNEQQGRTSAEFAEVEPPAVISRPLTPTAFAA